MGLLNVKVIVDLCLPLVLLITLGVTTVHAVPRPAYLTACKKSDPRINECALKSGRDAIPSLVKGDPSIHIPVLDPFFSEKMSLQATSDFKIEVMNFTLNGLTATQLLEVNMDPSKMTASFVFLVPKPQVVGKYTMVGKFIMFELNGKGDLTGDAENFKADVKISYATVQKKGVEHFHVEKLDIKVDMENLHLDFQNIVDGNEMMSANINKAINDNWKQFAADLNPVVASAITSIASTIVSGIFERIPSRELILD